MKKALVLVLALLMVLSLAACGGNKPTPAAPTDNAVENTDEAAPSENTNGLTTAFAGKTLVMGSSCDFPPYEFVGENGDYVGIDVEIATGICEKLGATLQVKDMEFKGIVAAVESGAIDFGMSGMTITADRLESVNFSIPYETSYQMILVKEGSDIKGKEDLEGKAIGVQAGTTGDDFATKDFGQDAVKQYEKYSLAIAALLNDQVDCVVLDESVAKEFAKQNEGLTVLDTAYGKEEYAVAFNKESTELLEAFNAAFTQLKDEGKVDEIFAKYKEN